MSLRVQFPLVVGVMLFAVACSHIQEPVHTPQPIVITKEVQVPVPVSCVNEVPPAPSPPTSPDIKTLTPDFAGAWDGIAWLKGYIAILKQDDAKLRAVLLACVKP